MFCISRAVNCQPSTITLTCVAEHFRYSCLLDSLETKSLHLWSILWISPEENLAHSRTPHNNIFIITQCCYCFHAMVPPRNVSNKVGWCKFVKQETALDETNLIALFHPDAVHFLYATIEIPWCAWTGHGHSWVTLLLCCVTLTRKSRGGGVSRDDKKIRTCVPFGISSCLWVFGSRPSSH